MDTPDLSARYAPGEDVRPLLRMVAGGLLGSLLALGLDRLVPTPVPGGMIWPILAAGASAGAPDRTGLGSAIVVLGGVLAAALYVYGQVRRFLPGPSALRGALYGLALSLLALPVLAVRAAGWLGLVASPSDSQLVLRAALVLAEMLLSLLVYGLMVGLLNPRRSPR